MSALLLIWRYVAGRPLVNGLTALGVAAGVALVVATLALSAAVRESATRTAGGYQLLVAARGSPLQAVLSTLFFMEPPTGNIPAALYESLKNDPGFTRLVPFVFGDSYRGHFIVGTSVEYQALLAETLGRDVRAEPAGRWFEKPFEAVVGASVARISDLRPGSRFVASHGFIDLPSDLKEEHGARPYTVVAVLERTNTPADRAIFTPLETTWVLHEHTGASPLAEPRTELTALLVQGRGYADLSRLAGALAKNPQVQAIFPARILTRLTIYLRIGEGVLLAIAWLAIGIAFIAVMISILSATIDRRRQIATLRAIGATRIDVIRLLLGEAAVIAGVGSLVGLALGRVSALLIAGHVETASGFRLALLPLSFTDLAVAGAAILLGIAAGALPAYLACREDAARNLGPAW